MTSLCRSRQRVWRVLRQQHAAPPKRTFTIFHALQEQKASPPETEKKIDVETLLASPTWSISSLLPHKDTSTTSTSSEEITPTQLHHLLRLSALPPPASPEEEASMLSTLRSQLHFVRAVQAVDTTGVEPLRSLRDETARGEMDAELGLEGMRDVLEGEEVRGKWHRRVRRKREGSTAGKEDGEWEVLGQAARKTGRYFVVEGGKKEG